MKKYYLSILVLFLGLAVSAQQRVYIGKTKDLSVSYKAKLQAAASNALTSEALLRYVLPDRSVLILQPGSSKMEGSAASFYGTVYNSKNSSFYLKIKGSEASGSIIMRDQKKFYRYSSTADGSVYLTEADIDKVLCIGIPEVQKPASSVKQPTPSTPTGRTSAVMAAIPILESLPGAGAVVYLDFDGQTVTNTLWNSNFNGGNPIVADPANLSEADMLAVWKIMSEDFRPFQLNVTTSEAVFNSAPINRRMRVIFTPTNYFYPNAGGVAYVGSFTWGGTSYGETPCWVWNTSIKGAGEAGSHESGHTLGLSHDGRTSPQEEYFAGQSSWAPIMGVGYYVPVVQWSQGEYPYANNTEDDLYKIATQNGFGYRADDHGNDIGSATPLVQESNGEIVASKNRGVITTRTDVDVFSFTTSGGAIGLAVNPDPDYPNLDVYLTLRNASGTVIATADPDAQAASLNATLSAGTYYLTVDGVTGSLGANSDYASIGAYSISTKTYCVPLYTDGCTTYNTIINNFSFNTLANNNSGCGSGTAKGYTNYAPTGTYTTSVSRGQSYSLKMQSAEYPMYFGVWIDYNRDKDFDDAGEFVYASSVSQTSQLSATITIPATAALGTTRMRVRSNWDPAITSTQSCAEFTWGEAEDYTITIANPLPAITTFLPVNGPSGIGVMIKGKNFVNVSAVRFNGVAATQVYKASTTLLYATVPSGATTGKIQVVTSDGTTTSATSFTVAAISTKWTAKASLATARLQHGALGTNGKIYVFGGRNSTSLLNALEIYDPSTNTWSAGAPMPVAIRGMAYAVGSNGSIYLFGGANSSATVASTYRYTPSTNTWTALAPMPVAIFEAAAAATSNGKIYVFGGEPSTAKNTSTNATRIYDIATNTWSSGAGMPVGVQQHSAVTGADGKIYVIGGRAYSAKEPLGLVQIYNPGTNSWTSGAAMLIPKVQFGAVRAADGQIYIIGGKASEPNSTGPFFHTVEIYNPTTNAWSSSSVLPRPLGQQTAVKLNDNLYAIGGSDATIHNYNYQLILAPVAPTSLTATAVSASQVNLKWSDKSLNESGFIVERAAASAGPFTAIASVGANTKAYSNTGLSAATKYYYRVKATNTAGSSAYSSVVSATTAAALANTVVAINPAAIAETQGVYHDALAVQPNPVRTQAMVTFTVQRDQQVRLEVYDGSGRAVALLYSGPAQAGHEYRFTWQAGNLPAGVYVSRLAMQEGVLSQKLIIVR